MHRWVVATFTERRVFLGHEAKANSLKFFSNSNTLASGGGDGTLKLWEVSPVETTDSSFDIPSPASKVRDTIPAPMSFRSTHRRVYFIGFT